MLFYIQFRILLYTCLYTIAFKGGLTEGNIFQKFSPAAAFLSILIILCKMYYRINKMCNLSKIFACGGLFSYELHWQLKFSNPCQAPDP